MGTGVSPSVKALQVFKKKHQQLHTDFSEQKLLIQKNLMKNKIKDKPIGWLVRISLNSYESYTLRLLKW